MPMKALFRGDGWGLGEGKGPGIFLEGGETLRRADLTAQLPKLLDALDDVARSGDPDLFAAGFVSYEAGVFLEGSTSLARPHDFLPFAEFSAFSLKAARRSAPPPPAAPSSFTFEEPARAKRMLSSDLAERSLSADEWMKGVGAIRDGIARGDVYQVNLSRRKRLAACVEPFALARALYADNPVPFALALVEAGWA